MSQTRSWRATSCGRSASRWPSLLRSVGLATAAAATAGCLGGGDASEPSPPVVTAPPQSAGRLAAIRQRYDGGSRPIFELVTLGADGTDVRVVVGKDTASVARWPASPSWGPDANDLFFTGRIAEREGANYYYEETDVFAVRPDGMGLRRLTETRDASGAIPSPDGGTLLFARTEHAGKFPITVGLWVMDANGYDRRRLLDTQDGQTDFPGTWSPDGKTIAFTRCQFRQPEQNGMQPNTCGIYLVARDGSGLRLLAERSSAPAFSPDGEAIAFVSDRDENGIIRTGEDEQGFAGELYVMGADGTEARPLTQTDAIDEEGPSWSPDASRLAYTQEGPGSFARQLMVIGTDGNCPTRAAGHSGGNAVELAQFQQPAWRPGRLLANLPPLNCP
jgi:Tol biopolymer transport system component